MSELSDIKERIGKIHGEVSYMRGRLDEKLPTLATTDGVKKDIAEHYKECSKITSTPNNGSGVSMKLFISITSVFIAVILSLVGVISYLSK